jgi:hypothetical protein
MKLPDFLGTQIEEAVSARVTADAPDYIEPSDSE